MRYKNTQEAMWGKEPTAASILEADNFDSAFSNALLWYQNNATDIKRKEWFLEWLDDGKLETKIKKLKPGEFTTAGSVARLVLRGVENAYMLNKLEEYTLKFIDMVDSETEEAAETVEIKPRVDTRYQQVRDDFEQMFDRLIENKFSTDFSMAEWIKSFNPSPAHLVKIRADYSKLLEEVRLSFSDPYFQEAYNNFTVAQKRRMVAVLEEIASAKKERKQTVRKKKQKPVEQIVAKVTYAKEDKEHGVASLEPKKVVGATCVVVWNQKYRMAHYLEAQPGSTFTIKGTTIQNLDEKKSFSKKIRKPKEVLPVLVSGGKVSCRKTLQELKTQSGEATGRLGSETVILKVF